MAVATISFFSEDTSFRIREVKSLRAWLSLCAAKEQKQIDTLSIVFCSDEYLLEVNQNYLKHDTFTDIITFDYSELPHISGDLFISIDRVRENAKRYKVSAKEELHRVIIHGVLHLCGYKDKNDRDQQIMRKKEDDCLSLRASIF